MYSSALWDLAENAWLAIRSMEPGDMEAILYISCTEVSTLCIRSWKPWLMILTPSHSCMMVGEGSWLEHGLCLPTRM